MDTEVKIEKDFIGDHEFEGTVFNEINSSEFIICMNEDIKFKGKGFDWCL